MINTVTEKIRQLSVGKHLFLVAIDGRCASGKTTLAQRLADDLGCAVVHMDDFFLGPHQRSEQRLSTPGENIDHERLLAEVLQPLSVGSSAVYRPFRCHDGQFGAPITVLASGIILFEGSYSCHPSLSPFYDLKIFLTVSPDEQLKRLQIRNPDRFEMFKTRWIPLEESYFSHFDVSSHCDLIFKTDH